MSVASGILGDLPLVPVFQVELTIKSIDILLDRLSKDASEFHVGFKFLHFPLLLVWSNDKSVASNTGSGSGKFSVKAGKKCRFAISFVELIDRLQSGQLLILILDGLTKDCPFEESKPIGCGRLDLTKIARRFRHGSLTYETNGVLDLFDSNCIPLGHVEVSFKLVKTNLKVDRKVPEQKKCETTRLDSAVQTSLLQPEPQEVQLIEPKIERLADTQVNNLRTAIGSLLSAFHSSFPSINSSEFPLIEGFLNELDQLQDLSTNVEKHPKRTRNSESTETAKRHAKCYERYRKVYQSQLSFNIYSQIYRAKAYGYAYNKAYLQRVALRYLQTDAEANIKPHSKWHRPGTLRNRKDVGTEYQSIGNSCGIQTGDQMFRVAESQTEPLHKSPVTPVVLGTSDKFNQTAIEVKTDKQLLRVDTPKPSALSRSNSKSKSPGIPAWIRRLETEEPEILNTSVYLPIDRLRTPQTLVEGPVVQSSSLGETSESISYETADTPKNISQQPGSPDSSLSSAESVVEEIIQTSSEAHSIQSDSSTPRRPTTEAKTTVATKSPDVAAGRPSTSIQRRVSYSESRRESGTVSPVTRYLQKLQLQKNGNTESKMGEKARKLSRFSSVHTESVSSYEPSDLSDISESQQD